MDTESAELQRAIAQGKIGSARAMNASQKFLAGPRLFDAVRRRMLAGIRAHHPDWSQAEIEAAFTGQLETVRRLEERGVFTAVGHE